MLTVNSFSNTAALTLLNGSNQNSVSSYLNSSVFKAKSCEIFGAISTAMSSAELQKDFKAYYERAMDSG
ncbi:hypothetical protein D1623_29015, partial [Klebsiella pneumoniae]|uniref:hypothetical protein n=1 Tax=Klebsiella pneumoniae TaxID=573 RepID=UPI000FEE4267